MKRRLFLQTPLLAEVLLVNAHRVKNVSGRKSDMLDGQWLQQLHSDGLLCTEARSVRHMHKVLVQMNLQLNGVTPTWPA